jgi:DNA modification methylase
MLSVRPTAIKRRLAAGTTGSFDGVRSTVARGDARLPLEVAQDLGLEPGGVDCIITSPPYWNLKRYADGVDGEIGHGQSLDEYLADMRAVFGECFKLVKDTGAMWVVVDTLRFPTRMKREFEVLMLPIVLAEIAQEVGWRFQDLVIWRKNKTLPYSGAGKLRNLVEYVLLLTKTRDFKHRPFRLAERHQPGAEWLAGWPERYSPLGKNPANVWDIAIPTQGIWAQAERLHFCPLPAELVRRCIDLTTDPGDVVLDPFSGIGTVPAQAEVMGRTGLGIELNDAFIEIFRTKTRPEFLATWEAGARRRQLGREDQAAEAELVLRLRALKAGKELMRFLEKLAQSRPSAHIAAKVESVIVHMRTDPRECIDVVTGRCDPLPVTFEVIADVRDDELPELQAVIDEGITSTSIRTFGLDIEIRLSRASVADDELYYVGGGSPEALYEFDVSRHGAFTQRPMHGLFPSLPRLLTTCALDAPVHPSRHGPLEQARQEGEKRLLQSLVGSGLSMEAMAQQLRIPRVELESLLQDHGLAAPSLAFAVSLPDDLLKRAEEFLS